MNSIALFSWQNIFLRYHNNMTVLSFTEEELTLVYHPDNIVLLFEEREYTLPSYTLSFGFQFEQFFAHNATGWNARLTTVMLYIARQEHPMVSHDQGNYDRSEWFALLLRYYYRRYFPQDRFPHVYSVALRYLIGDGYPHTSWLIDHGFFLLSAQQAQLLSVQPGHHDPHQYLEILHLLTFWRTHNTLLWQDCLHAHSQGYHICLDDHYFLSDYLWITSLAELTHRIPSSIDVDELPVIIL